MVVEELLEGEEVSVSFRDGGVRLCWSALILRVPAVPVLQRRHVRLADASGSGSQAAAGRGSGSEHRRHGRLLPHPPGAVEQVGFGPQDDRQSRALSSAGEPGAAAADHGVRPAEDR